jgi:RNA polymerase sigma-70 factor (ECF subfamily)
MDTTSGSLLERVRDLGDRPAWGRFVQLYTPLLFYWARRVGLPDEDAADLVQDVLATLVQKLPEFSYDPSKGFRSWLRTVTINKCRDRLRQPGLPVGGRGELSLSDIPEGQASDTLEEEEYRRYLVKRALHLMQSEFSPSTWKACWEHVVLGRPAAEVAAELGICQGAVYVAKARVLGRLRQELAGLLD